MCRLFGMSSAPERTQATFWLLDAPDSLSDQSRRDPDGTGLGYFNADGTPQLHKAPIAAYHDRCFAADAKRAESTTFLAHLRYATTGGLEYRNTQPFEQDGRLFAHNGVIEDLAALDAELGGARGGAAGGEAGGDGGEQGGARGLVHGDTDSERFFALVTREIRARGDVSAGIEHAARWIARHLPVYSLNMILATPDELWALRYPETHGLYVLRRPAGGHHGCRHLDHSGTAGRMRVHCGDLARTPAVVIASERMDDGAGWRPLTPGELLHVAPDLTVAGRVVLPEEPAHRLTLADLRPDAAAAQQAA